MTLEDLGNLGEFIASTGVLVTLIYLAIQIRQNTSAVKIQTRQAIAEAQFTNINVRATDPQLPMIIMKTNRGEPLTEEEDSRLYFHADATMRQFENFFSQYQAGVVSEKDWEALRQGMIRTLRADRPREIWSNLKPTYNEEFAAAVDAALNEHTEPNR
jgi:phosphoketolase